MPRVKKVEKARKVHWCNRCGRVIDVGQGYLTWSFYRQTSVNRCLKCPLPRPSELTANEDASSVLAALEQFEDTVARIEEGAFEDLAEAIRDLATAYQDAAENIGDKVSNLEQYFSGGETYELLSERQSETEDATYTLEDLASQAESFDPGDMDEEQIAEEFSSLLDQAKDAASLGWA